MSTSDSKTGLAETSWQPSSPPSTRTRRATIYGFCGVPWNREQLAWAAGFYDGEGCTGLHQKRSGLNRRGAQISCGVNQKYRDILEKFQAIIGGAGHIYLAPN